MSAAKMPSHQRDVSTAGRHLAGQGVMLVVGAWLIVVSLTWTYGNGDGWLDARWNDALTGLGLTMVTLIRLARPSLASTRTVIGLLGGWLVVAPFFAGYGFAADSTPATMNDVLAGALVACLAMFGRT